MEAEGPALRPGDDLGDPAIDSRADDGSGADSASVREVRDCRDEPGPRPPLLHRVTPRQLRARRPGARRAVWWCRRARHLDLPRRGSPARWRPRGARRGGGARRPTARPAALARADRRSRSPISMAAGASLVPVPLHRLPDVPGGLDPRAARVARGARRVEPRLAPRCRDRGPDARRPERPELRHRRWRWPPGSWATACGCGARYTAGLAEQAAQRQREVLERAQRSVAEERLQIARELHDVVAHSLSVIAVQSGVGRHVIEANPAEAKTRPRRGRGDEPGAPSTSCAGCSGSSGAARRSGRRSRRRRAIGRLGRTRRAGPLGRDPRRPRGEQLGACAALSPSAELSVYRDRPGGADQRREACRAGARRASRSATSADALVVEVIDDGRGAGLPAYLAACGRRARATTASSGCASGSALFGGHPHGRAPPARVASGSSPASRSSAVAAA